MPFDNADLPFPTAAELMQRAAAMTSSTPSHEVYGLIAVALKLPEPPDGLLAEMATRTGLDLNWLRDCQAHVRQQMGFQRSSQGDALALDLLARDFAHGLLLRVLPDRTLLHYEGTHWTPISDQALRHILRPMALDNPGAYGNPGTSVGQALTAIKDLAIDGGGMMLATPPPVINTRNAELWVGAKGLVEERIHRPETALRYVLPVRYEPDAGCPAFDKMLTEIFAKAADPAEVIRHVDELLGYAIQGVRNLPVILFFWGGGANGKSTVLAILQALISREQIWAGSLGGLSGDRFVLPNLADRLLFIEDDAKDGEALNDGLLKKISENKVIDTRRVRSSHGTSFCSMVMPIVAINGAPRLDDTSNGMRRRLQVIAFDRQFTAAEINPDLAKTIIATELPGVLNRLIAGLTRLRARGGFDAPAECEKTKDAFLSASNPLHAFLTERCVATPGKHIRISELYQAFAHWMRNQQQRVPFPERSLKIRLVSLGYSVRKSSCMIVDDLALAADVA
jgi:P4 family phage/plasmid primase-like protien